ncbi:NAD(P)H-binding protein [Qipengyuania sp. XHP0211]|uniref:NAD-dependent epimerase/dehydratase family protein n=1 Tax=Qipengyuania sp. XHP0211 TaxID=3038079 RepID=UPI00241FA280|nr:NAD-dependent epimerase/dehydratase family protein [Qipengyuania sp. XHP0211]MDG5749563.1 NAD(P)H-binding protein [Qipengyuania sp. XHP0211]
MKVLALGATGAIGSPLVDKLAASAHSIFVTTRKERPPKGNINYLQGNARDDAFLRQILKDDWDAIIDFMVYDTASFRQRMDRLLASTGQYIYLSSGRVFAQSDGPIIERSPRLLETSKDAAFLASDEYALAKARQEDLLRTSGATNWTIVRPYITFGLGRFQLGPLEKEGWLYRALRGRSIVFCREMMDKQTTLTNGRDVADMIGALAGNPAAYGEDFNLATGRAMRWSEILSLYLAAIETKTGFMPNVLLQDTQDFCEVTPSVPQVIYDRLYNRVFDPVKIGSLVDLQAMDDNRSALEAEFLTQLETGSFSSLDGRGEALRDKAAGEWTSPAEFDRGRQKVRYLAFRALPSGLIGNIRTS